MRRLIVVLVALVALGGIGAYSMFFYPAVHLGEKSRLIYIHTGWDFAQVENMLAEKKTLSHPLGFKLFARYKGYTDKVIPGRFRILDGMSNAALVNMLAKGRQDTVKISLHNIIYTGDLAGIVGSKMESDSAKVMESLNNASFLKDFGVNPTNVLAIFIPGTYKMFWTDTPEAFIRQMHDNYESFWTKERRNLAADASLTPLQVTILASIVQAEQCLHTDEKPIIAGLYINRIRKGMPLQSDPTLVYAKGDFSIMRVLNGDKAVDSPYNTYKHIGLPPGPINMPEPSSIDAVLHYDHNDYLYMCAEADDSQRHHFSKTLEEHNRFVALYHNYLNKRQIQR